MHEQSETIRAPDGSWINVYGRALPNAGQQLPGTQRYRTLEEAVAAAQSRSNDFHPELAARARELVEGGVKQPDPDPSLWDRVWKQLKDMNLYDTVNPQGTGSTKRGYSDIYPPLGR